MRLCKTSDPSGVGPFLAPVNNLNTLVTGPLDEATYQSPGPSSFRQEDFLSVPCMCVCKTNTPRGRAMQK